MGWGKSLEEISGMYDVCVCAQQPVVVNLTMRTDEGGFWSLNKVWTAKMSCAHTCLTRLVWCLALGGSLESHAWRAPSTEPDL